MRTFQSELVQDYDSYSFGYCHYAIREEHDDLRSLYGQGYLPYSGARGVENIFYAARSVRVNLDKFELSGENRRVERKFANNFVFRRWPISTFDISDRRFIQFCLNYFAQRHHPDVMPEERLLTILRAGLITDILEYRTSDDVVAAYVLEVGQPSLGHFWYSFYDLAYAYQSLGMWLMLDAAIASQKAGRNYYYLGTAYGEKGLYKTNFNQIEYWNGSAWIDRRDVLRQRCRSDDARRISRLDEWKATITDHLF